MERKTVAQFLDRCADRAELVDQPPATRRQTWYLAGLIVENEDQDTYNQVVTNTSFVLTRRRASQMIDVYSVEL